MTGAVVAAGMEALNTYEEYAAGAPVLWDLRDTDLSQYTTAEMEITNRLLENYPARRNAKSASLVRDRSAILLAHLWEVYAVDRFPMRRRAFLKLEEAIEWCTSDADA